MGLFIYHLTYVSSIECSLWDFLTTGREFLLHLRAAGRCPSYEWRLLPGQSGLSPTPGQWWWSLGSSSGHVGCGASLHSCPVDEKRERAFSYWSLMKNTQKNVHTLLLLILLLPAQTYTSHPYIIHNSQITYTHNMYVCVCKLHVKHVFIIPEGQENVCFRSVHLVLELSNVFNSYWISCFRVKISKHVCFH